MILEGNERGGAKNLAQHLLREDNDHVTVHELRGFIADDLEPALNEIYAVSRGTKAKKYMFSLSLNPPPSEKVETHTFMSAIERTEKDLGLKDQPRAIVFHEKNGRRHCHAVWSRIDAVNMKAIKIDFYKRRLRDISRDLYIEHGWKMPRGFMTSAERDPTNFTLAQWQQSKRTGKKSRDVKAAFQDCWAISDDLKSFQNALRQRGYVLANGRRGYAAIDEHCEVYAVARQLKKGTKQKDVEAKLGKPIGILSVDEARKEFAEVMQQRLNILGEERHKALEERQRLIKCQLTELVRKQQAERNDQAEKHSERTIRESKARQALFKRGLRGLLDHFTGKHRRIQQQNEKEAARAIRRDQQEKDNLVLQHLEQRRSLSRRIERLQQYRAERKLSLDADSRQYGEINAGARAAFNPNCSKERTRSPSREP